MLRSRRHVRREDSGGAFTLVEVVISTLVVGVMLVAALNMLGGVFRNYAIAQERQQGYALATALMAEILQSCYEDRGGSPVLGPEVGEGSGSRTSLDDVDD